MFLKRLELKKKRITCKSVWLRINSSEPKRKNFLSIIPLNCALNCLILALSDSAAAFVERWIK